MDRKLRFLVAEDEPLMQMIYEEAITELGHEAVMVRDGKQAQTILQKEEFDIILTDLIMPHLDGVELLKWFRSTGRTTFFGLVSGYFNDTFESYFMGLGAQAAYPKPMKDDGFKDVVRDYERYMAERPPAPPAAVETPAPRHTAPVLTLVQSSPEPQMPEPPRAEPEAVLSEPAPAFREELAPVEPIPGLSSAVEEILGAVAVCVLNVKAETLVWKRTFREQIRFEEAAAPLLRILRLNEQLAQKLKSADSAVHEIITFGDRHIVYCKPFTLEGLYAVIIADRTAANLGNIHNTMIRFTPGAEGE